MKAGFVAGENPAQLFESITLIAVTGVRKRVITTGDIPQAIEQMMSFATLLEGHKKAAEMLVELAMESE